MILHFIADSNKHHSLRACVKVLPELCTLLKGLQFPIQCLWLFDFLSFAGDFVDPLAQLVVADLVLVDFFHRSIE